MHLDLPDAAVALRKQVCLPSLRAVVSHDAGYAFDLWDDRLAAASCFEAFGSKEFFE